MFTSREASTTSWSEMPGLTITFLQEDGLFVIRRSSVLSSLLGSVCLYCGLRPFDARTVEISNNVG